MDDLIPGHIIQYIKQLKNLNVSKKTVSSNEGGVFIATQKSSLDICRRYHLQGV